MYLWQYLIDTLLAPVASPMNIFLEFSQYAVVLPFLISINSGLWLAKRRKAFFFNSQIFLILIKNHFYLAGDESGPKPEAGKVEAKAKPEAGATGFPPTFTEKPKIVPNETGTLVTMRFKVRREF